jgi:CheY-like chemotaxis protein
MKKKILIVEDELQWQVMLRHILEREGYSVEIADSYGDARTQLQYKKFDLAIVDLRLHSVQWPNVEGMGVVKEAYHKGVRSIVLTAYGSEELATQAFDQYNVVGFLAKSSWDPEGFRQLVKRGLGQDKSTNRNETNGFVARLILPRVPGVLDNILAGIIISLLLYVIGILKGVIKADPRTWLASFPSITYILLSVIVVLLTVLAYTLWKHNRRR